MKEQKDAYTYLANYFEYLNADCDYEKWSQYLIFTLNKFKGLKNGIDIGCGSGYFTRFLYKNGFSMQGYDISPEMLQKANEFNKTENCKIQYILQSVENLQVLSKVDFAISVNDCFNYIPPEKLLKAFKKVNSSLKKGGIFIFDISSENKLTKKVANGIFADDEEDVTYLSFNKRENDKIIMDVTLFVKKSDGDFMRLDEKHIQYIHKTEFIKKRLIEANFEIVSIEGHLGEDFNNSDRINFICKRQ